MTVRPRSWHHARFMRSVLRSLTAAALLLGATMAWAEVSPHVRVPENGATLRGGSFAQLDWSASPIPAGAEEWEAFLSVDGGAYYAFRITPHLDVARRAFTWLVPNVDAISAKLLIRTGDEKHETHFVIPGSFRIVHDAQAEAVLPHAFGRGGAEAAREGEANVVSWAAGDRSGADVTIECEAAPHPTSIVSRAISEPSFDALPSQTMHASRAPAAASRRDARPRTQSTFRSRMARGDILLATHRLNI
jgi:hypothetical protein